MAGNRAGKYRDDYHAHTCQRCYFCWHDSKGKKCKLPTLYEGGRCKFCKDLTDEDCANLRATENYLYAHQGFEGKLGLRVAKVLGIKESEVEIET